MPITPATLTPLEVIRQFPEHDMTLVGALRSRMSVDPARTFLIDAAGHATSYAEFAAQAEALSRALSGRGVKRGGRVAIFARNEMAHIVLLFALARLGAIFLPVNSEFGIEELAYVFQHADVSAVLATDDLLATAQKAAEGLPSAPWFAVVGQASPAAVAFSELVNEGTNLPSAVEVGTAGDVSIIIYTSGSTGRPKGVMHSQRNFLLAGEAYVERLHLQSTDRVMIILPLFHMNALFYSMSGTLAAGASAILLPKFSASGFWDTAADFGATVVNMIDTTINILIARTRSEYRPDHRLHTFGGGARPNNEKALREEFGMTNLFTGYGMTEIPGITGAPYGRPNKVGSMGILGRHPDPAEPWAQCRIVDATGTDVGVGEIGELLVKTPIAMLGYFRDEEKTREVMRDGWFVTGDLVRQDEDGYFFFIARKREIVRKRGENLSPIEVEQVVLRHPEIVEAAVVGVPGELGDEELMAVAIRKDGSTVTERAIADWCAGKLAPVKVPRYVVFVDSLPRTGPTKIAKEILRKDLTLRAAAVDLGATSASRKPT